MSCYDFDENNNGLYRSNSIYAKIGLVIFIQMMLLAAKLTQVSQLSWVTTFAPLIISVLIVNIILIGLILKQKNK